MDRRTPCPNLNFDLLCHDGVFNDFLPSSKCWIEKDEVKSYIRWKQRMKNHDTWFIRLLASSESNFYSVHHLTYLQTMKVFHLPDNSSLCRAFHQYHEVFSDKERDCQNLNNFTHTHTRVDLKGFDRSSRSVIRDAWGRTSYILLIIFLCFTLFLFSSPTFLFLSLVVVVRNA